MTCVGTRMDARKRVVKWRVTRVNCDTLLLKLFNKNTVITFVQCINVIKYYF